MRGEREADSNIVPGGERERKRERETARWRRDARYQ